TAPDQELTPIGCPIFKELARDLLPAAPGCRSSERRHYTGLAADVNTLRKKNRRARQSSLNRC
ncbi:hypothetical protein, partial [Accumulibacter sp.]